MADDAAPRNDLCTRARGCTASATAPVDGHPVEHDVDVHIVPSLLHTVPSRSTRGGVRVVGPCVSYTPSGYESRRRVFAVCGDRSGRERVPRSSSRRVLVVHRELIYFIGTLRARPLMAPDVDLRSTAIALRPGLVQPIGMAADYRSRSTSSEGPAPAEQDPAAAPAEAQVRLDRALSLIEQAARF